MGKGLKVNALVDTLNRHRPDQLRELRQRYPEQVELLSLGQMLGEVDINAVAVGELAVLTLKSIKNRMGINIKWLRRRLKRAVQIRLLGNIVSAVTSAGLISAVLVDSQGAAIGAAVINLISSVSLLIAQYLESPSLGKQNSLQDLFDQLIQAVVDIEDLEFKLTVGIQTQVNGEELLKLAQRSNAVVASVRRVEAIIGTSAV